MNEVSMDRRRADLGGPEQKMKGKASKTKGNCFYGRTLMNKANHTRTGYAKEKNLMNHLNNPSLKTLNHLNEGIYEIEKTKTKVVHDLPIQIGVFVFNYAKLKLLEFWEFINNYLVNDLYQLMECDTDSLYIAFARDNIDECVKPELLKEWHDKKWEWFSSEDTETQIDLGEQEFMSKKDFEKRTPGKFKPEFVGDGMVCLCSKVYHIWKLDPKTGKIVMKTSCKGVQQKRNDLIKENFLDTLRTQNPCYCTNAGFIKNNNDELVTYTQEKKGFSYFYAKREVLEDGVSTTHLKI